MSGTLSVTKGARTFRPEIQGVRAIAVIAVLIFHLWPSVLPGGYVGVDVFFVVSGFLITGLLLRQVERTGKIQVLDFYAKRIKRLLPAATLVLVAVGTCVSLLPILRWADTANEIAASALYFENWWLAAKAVDYLAADAAPSPLQHFWSLSVEEQYYIAWPLIFLLLSPFGLLRRLGPRRAFGFAIIVVGLASLIYSVYITPKNPGLAYFATTTRAWELALGGLLAVFTEWERIPERARQVVGVIGLLMIIVAVATFGSETVFPGYAAALPTIGAALLIVSGESKSVWSVFPMLKSKPFQYVGDLSYSLYLWHWPVVVFYTQVAGREAGLIDGLVIAVVSLALAHQTKELVEDRFRAREFASSAKWKPFGFALLCISLPLVSWGAIHYQLGRHAAAQVPLGAKAVGVETYPGAWSRTHGLPTLDNVEYIPDALSARGDRGDPYKDGCIAGLTQDQMKQCIYGKRDAGTHIMLVGDSHAVHWVPAFQAVAAHNDLRLTAITKSACAVVDLPLEDVELENYRSCIRWSRDVIQLILDTRPDAVIFAHSRYSLSKIRDSRPESADAIADSLVATWSELDKLGIKQFAIADTPSFRSDVPECLAKAGEDLAKCGRPRSQALPQIDPLAMAAAKFSKTRLLDYSDVLCAEGRCEPVIGNVLAWRDAHHMTATFARTMGGAISRDLAPLVQELEVSKVSQGTASNAVNSPGLAPVSSRCSTVAACPGAFTPSLAVVSGDIPPYRDEGCHLGLRAEDPKGCVMGRDTSEIRVFVVGDSHAAQWFPAYGIVADSLGWRIESYTKSACAFTDVMVKGGVSREEYAACRRWGEKLLQHMKSERPDYVLISQSVTYTVSGLSREESFKPLVSGYRRYLDELRDNGIKPIILADTPRLGINVPDCLGAVGATFEGCSRNAQPLLARKDPLVVTANQAGYPVISLNDLICTGDVCSPVENGILIWRDSHHVTATFAESVGTELSRRLQEFRAGNGNDGKIVPR